jgi:hypothetical protein
MITEPMKFAPQAESKDRKRQLKNYCYSLVERTEDDLAAYLASTQEHHEGVCPGLPRQFISSRCYYPHHHLTAFRICVILR